MKLTQLHLDLLSDLMLYSNGRQLVTINEERHVGVLDLIRLGWVEYKANKNTNPPALIVFINDAGRGALQDCLNMLNSYPNVIKQNG